MKTLQIFLLLSAFFAIFNDVIVEGSKSKSSSGSRKRLRSRSSKSSSSSSSSASSSSVDERSADFGGWDKSEIENDFKLFMSFPTASPTKGNSPTPTLSPVVGQTGAPTKLQTQNPTKAPVAGQTGAPTRLQTQNPTKAPVAGQTGAPTRLQTQNPSKAPVAGGFNPQCGTTEAVRQASMLSIFESVSNPTLLATPGTSQNSAAQSLYADTTRCQNDSNLIQLFSLAVFYFATDGDNWASCSQNDSSCANKFLSTGSECQWSGVTCNANNNVFKLIFESNNLGGTLPSELGLLTSIDTLQLEQGSIGGKIPTQLGTLGSLRVLDLDFNSLTGSIPEQLYSVTTLQQLDLNTNQLIGSISNSIGNLVDLRLIQVYENKLTGTIPSELGSASSLIVAEFYSNLFDGAMPQTMCALRSPPIGTGMLAGLTADCALSPSTGVIEVLCDCCTSCVAQ